MIAALQTARGGSKGVPNKNILPVGGQPLYLYNVRYALECPLIEQVHISTNIPEIIEAAPRFGYRIVHRPPELAHDEASHHDAIRHGMRAIEQAAGREVDLLVVLLGNSLGAESGDLLGAIRLLQDTPEADSVQSVNAFNMFNPFRAMKIDSGLLDTYIAQDAIRKQARLSLTNDRAAAGATYFFNGSFWVCRRRAIESDDGLLPFPWLGKRILPWIQQRTYLELDEPWQKTVLEEIARGLPAQDMA